MILIFGAGRQGECLAYALTKLHHDVFVVDQSISDRVKRIVGDNCWANSLDFSDEKDIWEVLDDFENSDLDLVISCLPYFLNFKIAAACVDRKIPYFDLGGHVGTSQRINDYSESYDGCVFTDLGLAPGWANILGEKCFTELNIIEKPHTVNMCCGGLPNYRVNPPFNYMSTWSTEGLINEYRDDCKILKDGKEETVRGMSGLEPAFKGDSYECFHTSGGFGKSLDLMKNRGVSNSCYKTVRYKGHRDAVKPLLHILSNKQFDELFAPKAGLTIDKVIVAAEAIGPHGYYSLKYEVTGDHRYSAMQKSTAFPVAAVAHMFVNGHDALEAMYNSFDYSHVDYNEFSFILRNLGLINE